jgi:hypothetical protein
MTYGLAIHKWVLNRCENLLLYSSFSMGYKSLDLIRSARKRCVLIVQPLQFHDGMLRSNWRLADICRWRIAISRAIILSERKRGFVSNPSPSSPASSDYCPAQPRAILTLLLFLTLGDVWPVRQVLSKWKSMQSK